MWKLAGLLLNELKAGRNFAPASGLWCTVTDAVARCWILRQGEHGRVRNDIIWGVCIKQRCWSGRVKVCFARCRPSSSSTNAQATTGSWARRTAAFAGRAG